MNREDSEKILSPHPLGYFLVRKIVLNDSSVRLDSGFWVAVLSILMTDLVLRTFRKQFWGSGKRDEICVSQQEGENGKEKHGAIGRQQHRKRYEFDGERDEVQSAASVPRRSEFHWRRADLLEHRPWNGTTGTETEEWLIKQQVTAINESEVELGTRPEEKSSSLPDNEYAESLFLLDYKVCHPGKHQFLYH